jgi:signal peptide peptidase SppA
MAFYPHYLSRLIRQPWCIMPEKLAEIRELVLMRASGIKLSDEEIADRLGPARPRPAARGAGSVAVIPVHGTIAHRADSFEASSGGTSMELVGRLLQRMLDDDSVKSILLDFDTPGGSVDGGPELAAKIAKGTTAKPIVAHVNALAASMGYWLASQCTEIVCTPSGMVGSIGVYLLLVDESEALAKAGITINAISAGDNKLEGAPWEPLSDETRDFLQAQVDSVYRQFVADVASGRSVSTDRVKRAYGQGRVFDAKMALSLGMIDRIEPLDATMTRLVGRGPRAASRPSQLRANEQAIADEHVAILAALSDY